MKRHSRVKDIVSVYRSGGMDAVVKYVTDENIIITEDTWEYKIKKLIEQKLFASTEAEIASLSYIFNLTDIDGRNSNYEHPDQGSEDGGDISD